MTSKNHVFLLLSLCITVIQRIHFYHAILYYLCHLGMHIYHFITLPFIPVTQISYVKTYQRIYFYKAIPLYLYSLLMHNRYPTTWLLISITQILYVRTYQHIHFYQMAYHLFLSHRPRTYERTSISISIKRLFNFLPACVLSRRLDYK